MIFNDTYKFRIPGHACDSLCKLTIPTLKISPAICSLVGGGVKVIVEELPHNPGMSICNAHQILRRQICEEFKIRTDTLVYLEYWPKWTAEEGVYDRDYEEYHLVNMEGNSPFWINLSLADIQKLREFLRVAGEIDEYFGKS